MHPWPYLRRLASSCRTKTCSTDLKKPVLLLNSANLPNQGQVPNLPPDAVIECPAYADAAGLHALAQPSLPPRICGTLATRFQWVETVVEAALEGRREKFVQALVLDGSLESIDTAWELADGLLNVQRDHLPQFQ